MKTLALRGSVSDAVNAISKALCAGYTGPKLREVRIGLDHSWILTDRVRLHVLLVLLQGGAGH
jgi:hypothetical protein